MTTRVVDVPALLELIEKVGILRMLDDLSAFMFADYRDWANFDKVPRIGAYSDHGVIELMPIANDDLYAFKHVNGHPENPFANCSTVMAYGGLTDVETGYPLLVTELTLSTALRTAAASALAAEYLTSADGRRVMAIIGCGAQSEFQALAFYQILGVTELRIFDIDKQAMTKFIENMAPYPISITRCADARDACAYSDIITTITADKTNATIITNDMVAPGMHINAVGGDCPGKTELEVDVLKRSSIFVQYEPQTRKEGEIQQLHGNHPVTELWKVLRNEHPGRRTKQEVTIFDSVGFALEDFSTLRYIYDKALFHDIGFDMELVPKLDNPKDLFGKTKSKVGLKKVA